MTVHGLGEARSEGKRKRRKSDRARKSSAEEARDESERLAEATVAVGWASLRVWGRLPGMASRGWMGWPDASFVANAGLFC